MLTDGVDIRFQHIIQHLIQHQSHAAAVDVTMDTDMDKSLRDRLVRMLIRNNVERGRGGEGRGGGQTVSTSFNIREKKRNVEWLLKQSLKSKYFEQEPIQRRFDFSGVLYFGWPNQPSSSAQLWFCVQPWPNIRSTFVEGMFANVGQMWKRL